MALQCPTCEQAAAEYVGMADDGRGSMRCGACGHEWLLGARPVSPRVASARPRTRTPTPSRPTSSRATATARPAAPERPAPVAVRFPTTDDVPDSARTQLMALKARFVRDRPAANPYAEDHRRLYQLMFSATGLLHAEPGQLKAFATTSVLALPGNTSSFAREWNRLGDRDASRRFTRVVEYLLRGDPDQPDTAMEDRFTELCDPRSRIAMTGFRERLLTHVLAVSEPERFLPVLQYSGPDEDGKRELAALVLGLELPAPERAGQGIGRLVFRSNDLLLDALGPGFTDLDEAARFLFWARDELE